jgi:Tfp pilus assembly protein PilE
MKIKNSKSGYSIVEIIIYIAVFTVLTTVVMNAFIVLTSFYAQNRTHHDLLENGNSVMERMSREIRNADNIRTSTSTFGTSPGALDLENYVDVTTSTYVKFSTTNGELNLSVNNTNLGNLLSANVQVTSLVFRKITTTNSTAVKIEMTLRDTKDQTSLAENFYDTIILRGGY